MAASKCIVQEKQRRMGSSAASSMRRSSTPRSLIIFVAGWAALPRIGSGLCIVAILATLRWR